MRHMKTKKIPLVFHTKGDANKYKSILLNSNATLTSEFVARMMVVEFMPPTTKTVVDQQAKIEHMLGTKLYGLLPPDMSLKDLLNAITIAISYQCNYQKEFAPSIIILLIYLAIQSGMMIEDIPKKIDEYLKTFPTESDVQYKWINDIYADVYSYYNLIYSYSSYSLSCSEK